MARRVTREAKDEAGAPLYSAVRNFLEFVAERKEASGERRRPPPRAAPRAAAHAAAAPRRRPADAAPAFPPRSGEEEGVDEERRRCAARPPPRHPRAPQLTPRPPSRLPSRAEALRQKTIQAGKKEGKWFGATKQAQTKATADTVKKGVRPKDAAAAAKLSEIFGVKVTVKTIVKYKQAKTTKGNPYFVPSIKGKPVGIAPSTCQNKLGPRAIRKLHGVA